MPNRLLWPTALNPKPGFAVVLGRLLHWLGMAAAVVVLVLVVVVSLIALAWRGGAVDPDGVLRAVFYFGVAAFLYLAGRGLRYLLGRE